MSLAKKIRLPRSVRLAVLTGVVIATVGLVSTASAVAPTVSDTAQKMPTFNGDVYASVYLGNTIYVGGSFTTVNWGGQQWARTDLAAVNAQTGALLAWAPTANGTVTALAANAPTHTIYAVGDFTTIDGTHRDSLAAVDALSGALGSLKHSIFGLPRALAIGSGRLYLGGHITAVDGHVRTNLAAFSLATGALDTTWAPTADGNVYSLLATSTRVYIGGKFHKINNVTGTSRLAAVSPTTGANDATFRPSVPVMVFSITVGGSSVFVGLGGQGGRAEAFTSTTGAHQWTFTTDGDIQAVAYLGGVVYVGGHFDNACVDALTGTNGLCVDGAVHRVKFAAVDAGTGLLQAWNPQGNGINGVFTLSANAGLSTVAAGGEFTTLKGVWHGRFAQFH